MKKITSIFAIIIILIFLVCAAWYIWMGREGVRVYYQGYVEIEPITIEVLIERLEKTGCTENGATCHYVYDRNESSLDVNLYKKGLVPYGPGMGFRISDNKLYAGFDIEGRPNSEKFENAVRRINQAAGSVVVPVDGTWRITNTSDTTNISY